VETEHTSDVRVFAVPLLNIDNGVRSRWNPESRMWEKSFILWTDFLKILFWDYADGENCGKI